MNIRTLTASILVLGTLSSGAFAGASDFINTGAGLSDAEANYAVGHRVVSQSNVVEVSAKAFAATSPKVSTGDYIDETNAESNQRSSNR